MTIQRMQLMVYRQALTAEFSAEEVVNGIREHVTASSIPAGQVEIGTVYRFRATDKLRRVEPYRFADPLPEWAVGVLVIADVEYGDPGELARRGQDRPLVAAEELEVGT